MARARGDAAAAADLMAQACADLMARRPAHKHKHKHGASLNVASILTATVLDLMALTIDLTVHKLDSAVLASIRRR